MPSDLRLALRSLITQPALTAAVVLPVALAIAACTSLFSIMDGLLFRPLPYRDAVRLVHVGIPPYTELSGDARRQIVEGLQHSPFFNERARTAPALLFEEGAEIVDDWQLVPTEVSPNLFPMLGVAPALGRLLRSDDEGQAPRPVLLGHALWRSRFGGDPKIVGRTITLPAAILNRPSLIVGIMPPGFDFPRGTNIWVPRSMRPSAADLARFPVEPTYARLAAGVTLEQVSRQFPRVTFTSLREHIRPRGGFAIAFLAAATGLLLLVAWAQVAALLFARAAGRAPEIAVRLALGAGRWQLVRQFAVEAGAVALAALALAWAAVPPLTAVILRLLPAEMTIGQAVHADYRTFLFACLLSTAGVLVLVLAPLEIVRQSRPLVLLRGGMFANARMSAARVRTALVVAQLALTTMLLYVGSLAFHSFVSVTAQDLGFRPDHLLVFRLPLLTIPTRTPEGARAAINLYVQRSVETVQAVRALPGVSSVASGDRPFGPGGRFATFTASADPRSQPLRARDNFATPGYLRVLGVRVLEGRDAAEDDRARENVALVNETFARTLRRFGPVIDQRLKASIIGAEPARVIGVVNDFVDERPDLPVEPKAFLFRKGAAGSALPFLVVRTNADDATVAAIRTVWQRIWTGLPARSVVPVADQVSRATADYRARTILLSMLDLLCLPLAVAGVAGSLAYTLRQRTREIAIRLAIGADPVRIQRRVVGRALAWTATGMAVGLAGGVGAGRWMSSYLFGVRSADLVSAAGVVGLLALTAWLAALVPARRAAHVDPAVALREI